MADRAAPELTELVYVPGSSALPAVLAAGLVGVGVGIFAGWVWMAIGAAAALLALRAWVRDAGASLSRMPRSQRVTTAVVPPSPPK